MILVEDSLFGLSSPASVSTSLSSASSSSLSSPTILTSTGSTTFACSSISSTTSSTPSTPLSHHQQSPNETLITTQTEFLFDYNDQVAKNLLNSKEIEQFLSNDNTTTNNNTSSSNSVEPYYNEADLERILNSDNNSTDLFYSKFKPEYDLCHHSRHHYFHPKHSQLVKEDDEDDEDLKYLELDLLSDSESSLENFSALFDPFNLQNIDDNINSLSSSMSNINTITNTETGSNSINNCFTDIADQSTVKSNNHLNSINNQNGNNIQQNVFNIQQQSICNHNLSTSSTNNNIFASITVNPKNARRHTPTNRPQLLRQDSQILFGSCCSSNTNTTFDSVSNYGSDGSSSTSSPSMPSTPSSIGVSLSSFSSFSSSMPSQHHPTQSASLISASNTNQQQTSPTQSVQALPSFIEIYTSPKYTNNQSDPQSFIQQQQQQQNDLNFNYINGTVGDFKIEDYLTDSEDEIENNFNLNKNLVENKTENSLSGICPPLNIQIKEELMDTNELQQQYPATMTQSSSPSSTTTTMADISIDNLPILALNSSSPLGSAMITPIKLEHNDNADENVLNPNESIKKIDPNISVDQKNILGRKILLSNNFLFSPTTASSSNMAKAMRINLHNLSLNQTPAFVCLTGQDTSAASYRSIDSNRSFSALNTSNDISTITENSHHQIQGPQHQSGIVQLEQANLVYQSSVQTPGASIIVSNEPASSPIMVHQSVNRSTYSTIGSIANKSSRNHKTKLASMQTCAVCGDVAACQHYGVLTCEGCKGFFKRTVQKGSKYTCLSNKDCTVDKRRRNRCQFCRFQKCLAVGMVKEVVRTDNLKGRRGRLPSKPKSPHLQESIQSPPMSTISLLLKAHNEILTEKTNLDFSQFNENIGSDLDNSYGNELIDHQVLLQLSSSLDSLMAFVEKIPGFTELTSFDQKSLFQNSCLELFALQMAYNIKNQTDIIILCNNTVLHRNQLMFTLGEWLPMIEELGNQLHSLSLDKNAFVCLCALTIITARDGVRDSNQIEQIENKIINSLRDHTIYNNEAQKKSNYFSKILTKLSELRTIGEHGYRIIRKKVQELLIVLPPNGRDKMLELERKITPINSHLPQSESHHQSNLPSLISNNAELNSVIDNSTSDTTTSSNHLEIDYPPLANYFGPI